MPRPAHRWLVFIHQLPARPSNARVKIWRRLQQIGAIPMKNAVYVLPNTPQSREDFEWLRAEVEELNGHAVIFAASSIAGLDNRRVKKTAANRDNIREEGKTPAKKRLAPADFQGRTWITRPRPGVDRFSSAWLIRRFIDPGARFIFGFAPEKAPEAVPFDMYQPRGFKHEGDRCTFEVLCDRFGIAEPAVKRIAQIVHDLDLKDDRFNDQHAPTVGALVEGLRASFDDDSELLERGMTMFEALYQAFQSEKRKRPVKPGIC